MGTDMDKSTARSHWNTKGKGYIKDQLELRGFKIPNAQLTGPNKLKKKDPHDATQTIPSHHLDATVLHHHRHQQTVVRDLDSQRMIYGPAQVL